MPDTITIWPQADSPMDWDMIEDFTEAFEDSDLSRNEAILEAMYWRLLVEQAMSGAEWWEEADGRERRMAFKSAIISELAGD